MANPVIRVSDTTHREVSHYAAKADKTMREVGDEIVRAGLESISTRAAIVQALNDDGRLVVEHATDADNEARLRASLPVETLKIASDYRRDLATRKRVEVVSLAESVARLVESGIKRLGSSSKYARKLHE